MHIIAADVGGTKTRLALADVDEANNILHEARYLSADFESFEPMLHAFINECSASVSKFETSNIEILTLALPGLVNETSANLTNLPWVITKQLLKDSFGIKNVYFMNDFQASALGTRQLLETDKIILNTGYPHTDNLKKNTIGVTVGAGTGLGLAWTQDNLQGSEVTTCAYDTEGGHIDFAPVDEIQIRLLQFLQKRHGHVSYERILSGDGLVTLYEFFTNKKSDNISAEWVNKQALTDQAADDAMSLFVKIYGAYIGNIALLYKPSAGIYITGGIAAKLLNKMQSESFISGYLNKGRMESLVRKIAVYVVTNERVGMLGAMTETMKIHHALSPQRLK
ncbi:MAG: glucokinase [Gammaproteobacteria bacterium]|nr:glucokinase [Gammaproteobacteria bacterium]